MRRAFAGVLVALTACGSPQPADTTPATPPPDEARTILPTTTPTELITSTTSPPTPERPGSESVGVTDKVTIVITDPDE